MIELQSSNWIVPRCGCKVVNGYEATCTNLHYYLLISPGHFTYNSSLAHDVLFIDIAQHTTHCL